MEKNYCQSRPDNCQYFIKVLPTHCKSITTTFARYCQRIWKNFQSIANAFQINGLPMHWQSTANALEKYCQRIVKVSPRHRQNIADKLTIQWQQISKVLLMPTHWQHIPNMLPMHWQNIANALPPLNKVKPKYS